MIADKMLISALLLSWRVIRFFWMFGAKPQSLSCDMAPMDAGPRKSYMKGLMWTSTLIALLVGGTLIHNDPAFKVSTGVNLQRIVQLIDFNGAAL